ncbi:hypothetical protein HDU96_007522 [Phlyctochytrium bullatum]|nr:hypothetical protein HDU96_007522 [Phlyctochytrium bullatum]
MHLLTPLFLAVAATAPIVLARPHPHPEPNCLADVIYTHGLERRNLQRRGEGAFTYEGAVGSLGWKDTCATGQFQSPINIVGSSLISTSKPSLNYRTLLNGPIDFVNNGHTVQVNIPQESVSEFELTQIDGKKYSLNQFHFHSPSEHHINGKFYPLELHWVHVSEDKKLTVIGILFDFGEESTFLCQLLDSLPSKKNPKRQIQVLNLERMIKTLNSEKTKYHTYSGSLTTPPCTEGVLWTVANRTLSLTANQLLRLQNVMDFNARPTQNNKGVAKGGSSGNSTAAAEDGEKPEGDKPEGDKPADGEKPEGAKEDGAKEEGGKEEGAKEEGAKEEGNAAPLIYRPNYVQLNHIIEEDD